MVGVFRFWGVFRGRQNCESAVMTCTVDHNVVLFLFLCVLSFLLIQGVLAIVPNLSPRSMKSSVFILSLLSVVAQDIEQVALLSVQFSVQRREDLKAVVEAKSVLKASANLTDAEATSGDCACGPNTPAGKSGVSKAANWIAGGNGQKTDAWCQKTCGCCGFGTKTQHCWPECSFKTDCKQASGVCKR